MSETRLGPAEFQAIYDHSLDGVLFTVPDGQILAANPAACEILGRGEEELQGLGRQPLMDPGDDRWPVLLAERTRTRRVRGVARMVRADGTRIEVEMSARIFRNESGQDRVCTIMRDVTARVRMERELVELSERLHTQVVTDELTGLHNRRGLLTIAPQVLEIAARQATTVAMLYVDIDQMKTINDRHGHDAGDDAICAVATALRQALRSADTVARIGGDEFAALALAMPDAELRVVAERIRAHLRQERAPAAPKVAVSIGWSVRAGERALTVERLLADADRAMYVEKAARRQSGA